jgi:uncharacterized membrane protein YdjX (TVP38/TMEM64 family)
MFHFVFKTMFDRLLLMLKLSPVLPDFLMNYVLSLTPVTFDMFASATAVAMVSTLWLSISISCGNSEHIVVVYQYQLWQS